MGINDRDDDYRSRGQAPRRRGPYESSEAPAGRSYQRGSRDDAPRGRSRDYDDAPPTRGYSRRDSARSDDPRSSSGSRHERGPDRGGHERRPRPDQAASSGRRPREDWDDDTSMRRERRGGDPYSRGERTARGPRPPARDDWDSAGRPRAPRGQSPADSGVRARRPGAAVAATRGGLWGEDEPLATGARRRPDPRDPRAARRGAAPVEEETTSSAATFGKAVLAIVLALAIGAGAAYGYYVISTPKIPANVGQPSSTPASGVIAAPYGQPLATLGRGAATTAYMSVSRA